MEASKRLADLSFEELSLFQNCLVQSNRMELRRELMSFAMPFAMLSVQCVKTNTKQVYVFHLHEPNTSRELRTDQSSTYSVFLDD